MKEAFVADTKAALLAACTPHNVRSAWRNAGLARCTDPELFVKASAQDFAGSMQGNAIPSGDERHLT